MKEEPKNFVRNRGKTMLENLKEIVPPQWQIFDNPLSHGVLTKEEVAHIFRKSPGTIISMATSGALPCHYVGDTMMFYYHEVVSAFLSDRLAKRRRKEHANHFENKPEEQAHQIRSTCEGAGKTREQDLQDLARSFDMD
jgi:hypothetical protein